jgi:monofunctional glycosyltransferase
MGKKTGSKRRWPKVLWVLGGSLLLLGGVLWLMLPPVAPWQEGYPGETALMAFRRAEAVADGVDFTLHWRPVPLARISPKLVLAVLIAEDDKFYDHEGFDWASMKEALEKNVQKGRTLRGGSTITQQLAKNLFLSPQQSIVRKLREAVITLWLEQRLSKRRILELYLNVIEWGDGIFGIEAAARHYYGKSAASLAAGEAIRLASVLPNPHRFSVTGDDNRRMNRKRRLLARRLAVRGAVPAEEAAALEREFAGK